MGCLFSILSFLWNSRDTFKKQTAKFEIDKLTKSIDDNTTKSTISKAMNYLKFYKNIGKLSKIYEDIVDIVIMLEMYIRGKYTIPRGVMLAYVAAIIYLITPIDLILDYIPIIGYADDFGVITYVISLYKSELDKFTKLRKTDVELQKSYFSLRAKTD